MLLQMPVHEGQAWIHTESEYDPKQKYGCIEDVWYSTLDARK